VRTATPTSVTETTATLNATVNPNGLATRYRFEYGTSARLGSSTTARHAGSGISARAVASGVSGLLPGTIYFYRLIAVNSAGQSDGRNVSFQTQGQPPGPLEAGAKVPPDVKDQAEGIKQGLDALDNFLLASKLLIIVIAPELGPELVALTPSDAAYFALEVAVTKIAADPPDPHFNVIALPAAPHLARVRTGRGISGSVARALNGLVRIEARVAALELAYLHCAERGQGAMRADRHDWAKRQDLAKERYAFELASDLRKLAGEIKTAGPVLQRSPFGRVTLTRVEMRDAQQRIARYGLPASLVRALRSFGLSPAVIRDLTHRLTGLRAPHASVRISPLAGLSALALNRSARAFAADAIRIRRLLRATSAG